ncbi:hypothetical protein CE557_350 [Cardinium endosymbiont of Sogatella furcifera]|uniref:hypothetical protein n=1 Tax=Cardinium endosymbiont of Sogatella furcifera TaxID=650378 RepID=UPI000E0FFBFC|nr:hypothetical protein [Cardinium endosymbiont of Sogatella furcifera]AXI24175.1 hypothetical protein CE557_350 [Cardinium endosymbiont of Sogatella furcifera]
MTIKKTFYLFLGNILGICLLLNSCTTSYCNGYPCERNEQSSFAQQPEASSSRAEGQKPRIVVVLHHGLGMDNSQLDVIEEALKKNYGDQVIIVKPTYREKYFKSILFPISHAWLPESFADWRGKGFPTQSYGVYQEVTNVLKAQVDKHPFCTFMIGVSQGRVESCDLANDYGDALNIKGVITINAPLQGVHGLQNKVEDVSMFLSNGAAGLKAVGFSDAGIKPMKSNTYQELFLSKFIPGIASMHPDSACIRKVNRFIDRDTTPCLVIGSYTPDIFNTISPGVYHPVSSKDNPDVKILEKGLAKFITGKEDGYHDGLIATGSQLYMDDAQIPSLIEHTIQQDIKNKNLYRLLLKRPTHAEIIASIMSRPAIPIDTTKTPLIERDKHISQYIIQFMDQVINTF